MIQFRRDWMNDIDLMQQEMNRLLEYLAGSKPPMVRFSPTVWEPAIDVYETDEELVVTVELAGVKETDMQILVDRNTLIVRGERRKPAPASARGAFYQMEIPSGSFERAITLPAPVDATHARASYEDGLLEIILPKAKERRTIKVEVRIG